MVASQVAEEVHYPDGRVSLASRDEIDDSGFANGDLAPLPIERRTWTTYNYAALWIGMSHNIPTYLLASGLIALGMNWVQALITIAIANLIVLVPMLLNSHAGTKYGIPYPVFARASFGLRGANLPALLRALVACAWFGIQTWIGGEGFYILIGAVAGHGWTARHAGLRRATRGRSGCRSRSSGCWRWPSSCAAWTRCAGSRTGPPRVVLIAAIALLIYMVIKAHGFGAVLSEPSKLGWGSDFWPVFFPSLMGMIAFWSTMSLNMPDFTRFGRGQRQQVAGQVLGLPTTMTFFSLLAVLITAASQKVYGAPIWDPIQLTAKFTNPVVIAFALFSVLVATLSVNVAANMVSPSYDFSNLAPKLISFRTGGLITGVIGILIQPWRLLANPHIYIFVWLGFYGGLLGAVAGVLIADYWLIRAHRAGPGRPVPAARRLLVQRRLELARGARLRGRRGAGRRRRLVGARAGPVPAGRADPGAETAVQLQLGGGVRHGPAPVLGPDGDLGEQADSPAGRGGPGRGRAGYLNLPRRRACWQGGAARQPRLTGGCHG